MKFPRDVTVEYSMAQLPILSEIEVVHASNTSAENAEDNYTWEQTASYIVHERQFIAPAQTGVNVRTAREKFEK